MYIFLKLNKIVLLYFYYCYYYYYYYYYHHTLVSKVLCNWYIEQTNHWL